MAPGQEHPELGLKTTTLGPTVWELSSCTRQWFVCARVAFGFPTVAGKGERVPSPWDPERFPPKALNLVHLLEGVPYVNYPEEGE